MSATTIILGWFTLNAALVVLLTKRAWVKWRRHARLP